MRQKLVWGSGQDTKSGKREEPGIPMQESLKNHFEHFSNSLSPVIYKWFNKTSFYSAVAKHLVDQHHQGKKEADKGGMKGGGKADPKTSTKGSAKRRSSSDSRDEADPEPGEFL
jgi:hypothetical protein